MARKRREVTIETERTLFISRRADDSYLWCDRCGKHVPPLTVEMTSAVLRCSALEVMRKIEDGQLHRLLTQAGLLRICPHSLLP